MVKHTHTFVWEVGRCLAVAAWFKEKGVRTFNCSMLACPFFRQSAKAIPFLYSVRAFPLAMLLCLIHSWHCISVTAGLRMVNHLNMWTSAVLWCSYFIDGQIATDDRQSTQLYTYIITYKFFQNACKGKMV